MTCENVTYIIMYHIAGKFGEFGESYAIHQTKTTVSKVVRSYN